MQMCVCVCVCVLRVLFVLYRTSFVLLRFKDYMERSGQRERRNTMERARACVLAREELVQAGLTTLSHC